MNLETLAKGENGGMYALLTIHPHTDEVIDAAKAAGHESLEAKLLARTRVDLIRI